MIRVTLHQSSFDLRAFLRNRQSQFFTLALPVLFLVIFASVFGGGGSTTQGPGGQISTSVYYVPGIIALAVIAACFGNLVASVTAQRERGVLKQRRATPVSAGAIIGSRVLTSVVVAVVMAAVLLGIGWAAYGAHVPGRTALALAVTVVIGAASFCCLGYGLTSLIRNEDAALPTTQALLLPLYFISGVFVAVTVLPHWLADAGEIFPVRHLANALLVAYNPHTTGLGFAGPDLLIVAAWGAAGLLLAVRKFSWLPLGRLPGQLCTHHHRRKTMTTEVQTQTGRCSTHGTVEAVREVPEMGFPFVVYTIRRALAQRRPYLCPECGAAVQADGPAAA
jgi:ABC-2 type transport system permease protein